MDDLGVVHSGKPFNLLPSPLSISVGADIFYEWLIIHLLWGKIGWQNISPKWYVETYNGNVRLQLFDIPEQDNGEQVLLGFTIPEWGIDPYIRWNKKKGYASFGNATIINILGSLCRGNIFERRDGMGYSGINLTNLQPIGRLEEGILSVLSNTKERKKGHKLEFRPVMSEFVNYKYCRPAMRLK